MEAMAHEGWFPTLELWEEPSTIMHKITPVTIHLAGVQEQEVTTFTCSGHDYGVADVQECLLSRGFAMKEVNSAALDQKTHHTYPHFPICTP